ncbi:MFS transporter [Candidatus Solirubrobacter pratensis]|uniref:MFS transporter n=1 Tax=Candidatus Solirubrobacter pratensis TaxID=1298857 RepID=UPI001E63DB00|nr:MFS transporter [Candidatus Solirubrobacter pratensis]
MPSSSASVTRLAVPVVLIGLNLRPLFASLPPLLHDVRADLGLSGAAAGLLTTGPLLCLGGLAPLGPRIARRWPVEWLLVACALATAAGCAARGIGGTAPLYLGTLLAGAAIALAQVVIPSLVRARAHERAGVLTGAFSMSLVGGATIAAFSAVPLERAFGSWRPALAFWGIPALVAAAAWLPAALSSRESVRAPDPHPLLRDPVAWSIAAFFGLQSMGFYSSNSWLPEILHASGISEGRAGTLNGVTNLVQVIPAFAVPVLAARARSQLGVLLAIVAFSLAGLAGVLAVPGVALLWMFLLGLGQGGALGLGLILPVLRGRSAAEVASMTALMMGAGYAVAAFGPAIVGAVHDATGNWDAPLVVLLAITALQAPAALRAVR